MGFIVLINFRFQDYPNKIQYSRINNVSILLKLGIGSVFFGLILFFLRELIVGFISAIFILIGCFLIFKGLKIILNNYREIA